MQNAKLLFHHFCDYITTNAKSNSESAVFAITNEDLFC